MNIANILINRNKRSTDETNNTDSIKFYHTVDEINEGMLFDEIDTKYEAEHAFNALNA